MSGRCAAESAAHRERRGLRTETAPLTSAGVRIDVRVSRACGKTTTLRMVAGFEDATSGRILLDGKAIDHLPPQRRPMAMVFQSYALFPHLTVAREHRLRAAAAATHAATRSPPPCGWRVTSMNLVGLEDRSPHELSGGQQQRVALARALVVQPKVLLFDEPLSNLDAKLRDAMRAEIRRIQKMFGITSIYVTHDQDEAMSMSDRIVVMNKGRVEQVGHTGRDLRPAGQRFRRRLHRPGQLPGGGTRARRRHDRVTVTVLGRQLTVAAHSEVTAGTTGAYLMVRPETVRLSAGHRRRHRHRRGAALHLPRPHDRLRGGDDRRHDHGHRAGRRSTGGTG